ncbi:uncharacterized protein SCHCODRAFT_01257291 [Schizophyllum commune H4-8]|uniref:uncharacterized protein n=1 Tax=Schizophyllum commune (strain H4-8 / FGSC 9210) TaxID=578458 RepID=UPI002160CC2D|nr:uncharacterized protein SCHCODRAFT_01257291 [Schizophyllum commune H4-8]KAI5885016.1 hypothetical protein SCHCODRAFT_01257291 [Schizophyllum commune H4-8]
MTDPLGAISEQSDGVGHAFESLSLKDDGVVQQLRSSSGHNFQPAIGKLSSDVLSEIFSFVCDDCILTSRTSTPVVLPHVSRFWRALALGCPTLWSSIHIGDCPYIVMDGERAIFLDRVARAVHMYLARSNSVPIDFECRYLYATAKDLRSAIGFIVDHSLRWRRISISADLLQFLDGARGHLPLLESAEVMDADCGDIPSGFDLFSDSPRLKRWRCDYSLSRIVLPWAQLEDVAFRIDCRPGLAPVNSQLCRLRKAVVNDGNFSDTEHQPDIIRPPTLVELTVQSMLSPTIGLVPRNPARFLDKCTFDHLRSLSIRPDGTVDATKFGNISWSHVGFMRMVERSQLGHTLRRLVLHRVMLSIVELLEVLRALPCLKCLDVRDPVPASSAEVAACGVPLSTGRLLEALTDKHAERSEVIVPHLQRLTLHGQMATNDATVIGLVQSRPSLIDLVLQFTDSAGFARPSPLSEVAQAILSEMMNWRRCLGATALGGMPFVAQTVAKSMGPVSW